MKERMKILIAYDGSECAQSALDELKRAGLPRKAEAIVLSVYSQFIPVPSSFGMVETDFPKSALEEKETIALARRAATSVKSAFNEWDVHAEAALGSPASVIVQKADGWKPDLIIIGSHGRSGLGRVFLGSVSLTVLHNAHCTVRIARGRYEEAERPARIVIGVDGSKNSEAAVKAVAERNWPAKSEVRIVSAIGSAIPVASDQMLVRVAEWVATENARVKEIVNASAKILREAGLTVSTVVKTENPQKLLVNEAHDWKADCVFVGARGVGVLERMFIGSVSSTVAARASCSVEVVRI